MATTTITDTTGIKYRKKDWFDSKKNKPMFGIDGRFQGEDWKHMAEDGKPLVFKDEAKRDAKLKELRAAARR